MDFALGCIAARVIYTYVWMFNLTKERVLGERFIKGYRYETTDNKWFLHVRRFHFFHFCYRYRKHIIFPKGTAAAWWFPSGQVTQTKSNADALGSATHHVPSTFDQEDNCIHLCYLYFFVTYVCVNMLQMPKYSVVGSLVSHVTQLIAASR